MTPCARRFAGHAFHAGLLGLVAMLVIGAVTGTPVGLGYVETGSMAPTLAPGDGYIAIPPQLAGDPAPGDVVVYRAVHLNGGSLTTHRIVATTEAGYVTRGDANPVTDQAAGEPPVQAPAIVATLLTIDGHVVAIPGLGTLTTTLTATTTRLVARLGLRHITGGTSLFVGLVLVGLAINALGFVRRPDRRQRPARSRRQSNRGRRAPGPIIAVLVAVLVITATASMVVPGGSQRLDIISAENDAPGPRVIQAGTTEAFEYPVRNDGLLPVVVVLRPAGDGVTVDAPILRLGRHDERHVPVSISAPPATGYYQRYLVDHRYLAILPQSLIMTLSRIHPWLPILAIDLVIAATIGLLGVGLLGTQPLRVRRRRPTTPLEARVRGWL